MSKKVIDISPPVSKGTLKSVAPKHRPKIKFLTSWRGIVLLIAVIGLVLIIVFTARAQLDLTVFPRLKPTEFSETIEAATNTTRVSFENRLIPARLLEAEVSVGEQFKATGTKDKGGKAQGTITVFNECKPPRPITLVPSRFLSGKEEKIFWSLEKIHLPPARFIKGKLVPGTVEVKVEAEKSGEDYNIAPSTFSLPALSGQSLYYCIYGKSKQPMKGGFESKVKLVTDQDLQKAREGISKALLDKGFQALAKKAGPQMVLLKAAVNQVAPEEEKIECLATEGMEASEFSCKGTTQVKGVAFSKADINELAKQLALSKLPAQTSIAEGKLTVQFSNPVLVLEKGKLVFDAKIKAWYYKDISLQVLKAQIAGKNQEQIRETVFARYPQVKDVNLRLSPFWMWRAPKNQAKIDVTLKY